MKNITKNVISGLLVVVSSAFAFFTGFVTGETKGKTVQETAQVVKPVEEVETQKPNNFIIGETQENNGIELAVAEIPVEDYAVMGVAESAESAYTVTARVLPATAGDPTLHWGISWYTDDTDSWGEPVKKNVEDYVVMSEPEAIGSTLHLQRVTFSCYQPFGTKIFVGVVSNSNPSIGGSFCLDYARTYTCTAANIGNISINIGDLTPVEFELSETVQGDGGEVSCSYVGSDIYTIERSRSDGYLEFTGLSSFDNDGTLGSIYTPTEALIDSHLLKMKGFPVDTSGTINGSHESLYFDWENLFDSWAAYQSDGSVKYFGEMAFATRITYFEDINYPGFAYVYFTIYYEDTGLYDRYFLSELYISGYRNSTPVSGVVLDSEGIVF